MPLPLFWVLLFVAEVAVIIAAVFVVVGAVAIVSDESVLVVAAVAVVAGGAVAVVVGAVDAAVLLPVSAIVAAMEVEHVMVEVAGDMVVMAALFRKMQKNKKQNSRIYCC